MNKRMSFGKALARERKFCEWTQKKLISEYNKKYKSHITLVSFQRWENDKVKPRYDTRKNLYMLFNKTEETWGVIENQGVFWNVPFARNLHFTGREQTLVDVHKLLVKKNPVALCGMGGIGKTQTAIEYVYRQHAAYDTILWLGADTLERLTADIVACVDLLELPERKEPNKERVIRAFKNWLLMHTSWLLIFDNVEDIEPISPFFTLRGNGAILLTTRLQHTGRYIKKIEMEQFSQQESIALLLRQEEYSEETHPYRKIPEQEIASATQLHHFLSGLPLALDQAAAYIEETQCSLSDYLKAYQGQPARLLSRIATASTTDYSYTVATTWTLSFQRLSRSYPTASDLMSLCAFLHPDAIPLDFIIQGSHNLSPLLQKIASDEIAIDETIGVLINYSLLRRAPEKKTLTIHRLVQLILAQNMDDDTRRQWAERAILVVDAAFPSGTFASWGRCEFFLPHVRVCVELIKQHNFVFIEAASLLQRAGEYLTARIRYPEAQELLSLALEIREQQFGHDHLYTSQTLNALGRIMGEQGHFTHAESYLCHALRIRENHPEKAQLEQAETLYYLAGLYNALGRFEETEECYRRSLQIRQRLLGEAHSDTVAILNDLGGFYTLQHQLEKAEAFIREALAIRKQQQIHPDIANSLNDLALVLMSQNKLSEAEQHLVLAIDLFRTSLGAKHRHVAMALNNLACVFERQERYDEAKETWIEAIAVREYALGPQHIDLINLYHHLVMLYQKTNNFDDMLPYLERAVAVWSSRTDQNSPKVATKMDELSALYQQVEKSKSSPKSSE